MTIQAKYDKAKSKVWTGEVRLSFPSLYKTAVDQTGKDTGKYSLTMLVPKTDKLCYNALLSALNDTIETKYGSKIPKGLKLPIKDGDSEAERTGREETKGFWVVGCSNQNQPGVVDKFAKTILEKDSREALERKAETDPKSAEKLEKEISELTDADVYAGCWVRVTVNPFAWGPNPGGIGISFSLQNVQKLRDDESFSGRAKATNDFDATEADSEEEYDDAEEKMKKLMGTA